MIHHIGVFARYETERVSEFWRTQAEIFFAAAIAAGGRERHAPRHWPEYRAYCAFVSDPDGNNVEAVHKET